MPYINFDPATAAAAPATTVGAPLTSVGKTLAVFRTDLTSHLRNRTDISARLDSWINAAYLHLCSILKLENLKGSIQRATVASQPLYLLPATVRSVRRAGVIDPTTYTIQGGRYFQHIDADQYRMLPDSTDEPIAWFREQNMIVVYPTPDDVRTMVWEVTVRPADLINVTDSPILPPEFHEAILKRAVHNGWFELGNHAEAGIAQNEFVSTLRPLIDTAAEEDVERLSGVRPVRRESDLYQRDSRYDDDRG